MNPTHNKDRQFFPKKSFKESMIIHKNVVINLKQGIANLSQSLLCVG